ncbi:MAG: (Fe-S)-binding protein, partial [Acidimicrobiales bacterium]
MDLKINADDLNACVQCGLCLPHCPTYRVTGDEALSPRGRIHLMREVQDNDAPVTTEVVDAFDTCVQCRGCEPACPSGVPYGRLIESTRAVLADTGAVSTRRQRLAFWALSRPRTLRLGSTLLAVAARLRLVPERLGVPTDLPFTRGGRHTSGDDIYLFTGCVMDAWQRDVHDAGQRVLEAAGVGVTPTGDLAPCCGALHTHAGLGDPARQRAEATITALSTDHRPILVDSAGCGAAMKEYGHLLGTPEAEAFSARVYDIHEWLATRLDDLP